MLGFNTGIIIWPLINFIVALCQIQLGRCSITIVAPEDIAGQIFAPTPQYAIGLQEFNVTGEVILADPPDGCEIRNNVTGKIVIAIMDETLCLSDIIMNAVLDANGLVSRLLFII